MSIINEQNCPALRYIKWNQSLLKHPEFVKAIRFSGDKAISRALPFLNLAYKNADVNSILDMAANKWDVFSQCFRKDIWTTSIAYGKAFENASESIYKHRLELYRHLVGETYSGTFIQATEDMPLSILYYIDFRAVEPKVFPDGRDGLHITWAGVILMLYGKELAAACSSNSHNFVSAGANPPMTEAFVSANGSVDAGLLFTVLDNIAFRRFADVSVRLVGEKAPTAKEKNNGQSEDNRLIVKSSLARQINRYDINWYTESVRTAGFARKGYIGIRWKGPRGNQHPEFVPIKATWVRGYTRKAKKPQTDITINGLDCQ